MKQVTESMPPSLRNALEDLKTEFEGVQAGRGEVPLEAVADSLGDPAAVAWVAELSRPSEPDEAWSKAYEGVLEHCVVDGWTEQPEAASSVPAVVRAATLGRGDLTRKLILTSVLGISSLQLVQVPLGAPESV